MRGIALVLALIASPVLWPSSMGWAATVGDPFIDVDGGSGEYDAELGGETAGGPGVTPVSDRPEGFWATWRTIDAAPPPPCLRDVGAYFDVPTQADADALATTRSYETDRWVEEQLTFAGNITYRCDDPTRDPLDAQTLVDLVEGQLPRPTPTISGGRAITGLRSWLDLGRPAGHTNRDAFDLGALGSRRVQIDGTAVARIDWGDRTVTEHTGTGGPYHPGDPGPDDITHTYLDTGAVTITVVDTWDLTFTIDGLEPLTVTATLDPVPLPVDITQVRSVRER